MRPVLNIVVDENMPKVAQLFNDLAKITYVNGRNLTKDQLSGADALLVRSVTKVNQALLEGTGVKFVGTATIGVDHIDQDYLTKQGIGFASSPGCNANAVADYVMSALSYLYLQKGVHWLKQKVGVVGFGNVGQTVYKRLVSLGCDVIVYDPYKERDNRNENDGVRFVSLEEIMRCDVISLHAPLTHSGQYPTHNMIDKGMLSLLKAEVSIISAGRGGVLHEKSLIERYDELNGKINLVLDVWDGEPDIDLTLLTIADIATPHIAGYSLQGRERGTLMVYQAFCKFFNIQAKFGGEEALTQGCIKSLSLQESENFHLMMAKACHAIYNVAADDAKMRRQLQQEQNEGQFDLLRKQYVERDEFSTCKIQHSSQRFIALGFNNSELV